MSIPKNKDLELDTYVKLMRASESLTARIHRHLAASTLTISQFGVLEALHHLGPLTQKEIGIKILRSGGNVTLVVDNLEKRHLVERKRHKNDRRSFVIHLTTRGKKLIKAVFPRHANLVMEAFSILSTAEQEQLGWLCKKIGLQRMDS